MGVYSEYLHARLPFEALSQERKKQLQRISAARNNRAVLAYAADLAKENAPISIRYDDLVAFRDQLANLEGDGLDLILETPGGSGEVAEDIVNMLRDRFTSVAVIVPGWAKSAGTLVALAGDEILMGQGSALGPIDAQLAWHGKVFSAHALIEGMEKIKKEVVAVGALNKAYVPILSGISPGELQSAENAQKFAETLVTQWLANYKFKFWDHHKSTGKPVTDEEKLARAKEIAARLGNHSEWLTHGRSIRLADLRAMRLLITDFGENQELADAIRRYQALLRMTFSGNVYKLVETPSSQVYQSLGPQMATVPLVQTIQPVTPALADSVVVDFPCPKCGRVQRLQANFGARVPLLPGNVSFPGNNTLACPTCGTMADLSDLRKQIEGQAKRPVIA